MKRVLALLLLLAGCASSDPQTPLVPEWDAIPGGIVEALCARLSNEGVRGAAIVKTTQPIATERAAVALAGIGRRRAGAAEVLAALRHAQKTIPIAPGCDWTAIDVAQRRGDQMTVELSAPMPNPFVPGTAGLFARLTLGGEHGSWYWIALAPQGGGWTVGGIQSLAL